jgi:uncharacterized tellurite resistance protein B-like protein
MVARPAFEAALFQQLMTILKGEAPPKSGPADLREAVAVLLLEAAHRDQSFSPEERAAVTRLLMSRFQLSEGECRDLIAAGEKTNADMTQLHPYTRAVAEQMDPTARIELIEMLWDVAYADGVLDPEEDALIRRIGSLIYVSDRDRVLARHRVLARLGLSAS